MTKEAFKEFVKTECLKRGFKKHKNAYFIVGSDLLCSIRLQKSNFGKVYYINYQYYLGEYRGSKIYPTQYDSDVSGRIVVISKTDTYQGKHFMTGQIEYEEYTAEELKPFFEKSFEKIILPPILYGKKYILDHLNENMYYLTLNREEVLRKLQS